MKVELSNWLLTAVIFCVWNASAYPQSGWVRQNVGLTTNFYSCYFIADTGWIVGTEGNNNGGLIIKTSNGGNNWTVQYLGSDMGLYSISFADNFRGYAVGYSTPSGGTGVILRTSNRGATWTLQPSGTNLPLYSVYAREIYWLSMDRRRDRFCAENHQLGS